RYFQTSIIVSCKRSSASCSSPVRKNACRCSFDESISNILPKASVSPSRAARTSHEISSSEISGAFSRSFTRRFTSNQTVDLARPAGFFPIHPKSFAGFFEKIPHSIKAPNLFSEFKLNPASLPFKFPPLKFEGPADQRILPRLERFQPAALVSRR